MQTYIRKLQRLGKYSYAVVLPKKLIDRFGWQERQKLLITFGGRVHDVVIKDWPSRKQRRKQTRKRK